MKNLIHPLFSWAYVEALLQPTLKTEDFYEMKIKTKKLRAYLIRKKMSTEDLAQAMGVSVAEINKMLNGQAVGINTARKFIRYFTAGEAQALIDWEAIGKENPLACEVDKELPDSEDDKDE